MNPISRRTFMRTTGAFAALTLAGGPAVAWGDSEAKVPSKVTSPEKTVAGKAPNSSTTPQSPKVLVAYFSCTGTTERVAEIIADELGADLYRIEAKEPYTADDIAYYTDCRADKEQAEPALRPALGSALPDMDTYDAVVLGHPIWHGMAPRIVCTFVESCNLAGKTVLPFCTSHSSGVGSSAQELEQLCSTAHWLTSSRFGADASAADIIDWLHSTELDALGTGVLQETFDLEKRTVVLNNGLVMPTNGLGTYSLQGQTCVDSVLAALDCGVRLIDTAYIYGNEAEVGRAIRMSGVPRDEVFVITKLYPSQFNSAEAAIEEALEKLDIDYIDMMLLHHPGAGDIEAYQAIERAIEEGNVRSAGLSCYYIEELSDFLPQVSLKPALVQNEIHPYYQDTEVVSFIQEHDIAVQAWYPLGGRGHNDELLTDPILESIAADHQVFIPQVILRWNLQRGVVVIPGSSDPTHIQEDNDVYSFSLSDEEMEAIAQLNRDEKHDWY